MTATQWTVNAIKDHMRAAGSHWFDPDTMRFFGTNVLGDVYQGPGGIYFITSEQPPHGKRAYSVRKFDPSENEIDTAGEFCSHKTLASAERKAKNLAAGSLIGHVAYATEEEGGVPAALGGLSVTSEEYKPVSILDQFVADLDKHSLTPATVTTRDAKQMVTHAKRHHHLMEMLCSDEAFCKEVDADGNHPQITDCRARIEQCAKRLGAKAVIFSGDPRGCTVKLVFADGATNDFGKEGWCVPTSLKEDE